MKQIAVITGASSGIGKRFAETVDQFGKVDEVWVIARRQAELEALRTTVPYPLKVLAMDLTDRKSFSAYEEALRQEQVQIRLLVNASGFGKFCAVADCSLETNLNMTDLNCQATVALCQLSLPCMSTGSQIINIASAASFQPIPYISIYGATKAFVLSFSRALNREVRKNGIRVTAVCPLWTKTAFFSRAVLPENQVVKKYVAMYDPDDIVKRAWRDVRRGRDISLYGFVNRSQRILTKLLPHRFVMDVWMRQQEL